MPVFSLTKFPQILTVGTPVYKKFSRPDLPCDICLGLERKCVGSARSVTTTGQMSNDDGTEKTALDSIFLWFGNCFWRGFSAGWKNIIASFPRLERPCPNSRVRKRVGETFLQKLQRRVPDEKATLSERSRKYLCFFPFWSWCMDMGPTYRTRSGGMAGSLTHSWIMNHEHWTLKKSH